ncbi:hypothetical protein [Cytobacillus sp.]|uniref:hypothetical protein n=1 Tax=Cytobacillus sp. TaxID=2675269 RepID=UPI0035137890
MSSRSIKGSFNNSNFDGNTNIQSDNNTQIQNITKDESEKAFQELFAEIKAISNEDSREQAEMNAESLQEALDTGDTKKGQRLIKLLKGTIGTTASLVTIARFFGITI